MHNHSHSCVCSHTEVKYCSHCKTVYCTNCNQEWTAKVAWTTTYTYPYTSVTGGCFGNYNQALGNNTLDAKPITNELKTSCQHH